MHKLILSGLLARSLLLNGCLDIGGLWDLFFGDDEAESAALEAAASGQAVPQQSSNAEIARNMEFFEQSQQIDFVPFPAVPLRWTQESSGKSVIYKSPEGIGIDGETVTSEVRIIYTKRTHGQDAQGFINSYITELKCDAAKRVGVGFYTAACPSAEANVIAIGELGNMYQIEITGVYDRAVKALVEGCVRQVVGGKRVFRDRNIGLIEH